MQPDQKSFKQLTISVEKLPASTVRQAEISQYATDRARLLLGCYRTGDANDPETYVAAIAATLARYSEAIITAVTHPVSGLPSKKSWLPTVKEVHDDCEELDDANRQQLARERRIAEQLALREEEDRQKDHRPTLDEMRAKYGPNWGLTPQEPKRADGFRAPSWQAIGSMYQADPIRLRRLMDAANYLHRDTGDQHPGAQQVVGRPADSGNVHQGRLAGNETLAQGLVARVFGR